MLLMSLDPPMPWERIDAGMAPFTRAPHAINLSLKAFISSVFRERSNRCVFPVSSMPISKGPSQGLLKAPWRTVLLSKTRFIKPIADVLCNDTLAGVMNKGHKKRDHSYQHGPAGKSINDFIDLREVCASISGIRYLQWPR